MTKTTVVCWIVGIIGIIGFFGTLNIPQIYAGSYMVLCVLIVLGAMYFNVKYKEQARDKAIQESLAREKVMQETLDREKARQEAIHRAESVSNDKKTKETNLT